MHQKVELNLSQKRTARAERERMWRGPYLYLPYASNLYASLLNSDDHKDWIYSHMKGRSTDGHPKPTGYRALEPAPLLILLNGRGGGIRTRNPLHPIVVNQRLALYTGAALRGRGLCNRPIWV